MQSATTPARGLPHSTHMLCQKMDSRLAGATCSSHPGVLWRKLAKFLSVDGIVLLYYYTILSKNLCFLLF